MTKQETMTALNRHQWVAGGKPGTEDYDEGHIISIEGDRAVIAWSSGVRTTARLDDLTLLEG